jgi:hypothetical protein
VRSLLARAEEAIELRYCFVAMHQSDCGTKPTNAQAEFFGFDPFRDIEVFYIGRHVSLHGTNRSEGLCFNLERPRRDASSLS